MSPPEPFSASFLIFFFNVTAPPEFYTLSLHDALPIFMRAGEWRRWSRAARASPANPPHAHEDRKSTRLNSSHEWTSYAGFCIKIKNSSDAVQAGGSGRCHGGGEGTERRRK